MIVTGHKTEYEFEESGKTILPRMYSTQSAHVETYRNWTGLKEGEKPGFIDNLNFMFSYQFGHMYLRYFLFNFSGRQSDIQHADWQSPLSLLTAQPTQLKANKANNQFPYVTVDFGDFWRYLSLQKG